MCVVLTFDIYELTLILKMIAYITHEEVVHVLTPEGAHVVQQGSHEALVWAAVPAKGDGTPLNIKELKEKVGDEAAKVGQGRAFKNGWIGKEGEGLVKLVRTSPTTVWHGTPTEDIALQVSSISDVTRDELKEVESTRTLKTGDKALAELRKRKLAIQKYVFSYPALSTSTKFY
jgi:phenylalanyl-tRNA synthetase alpha chain